MTKDEIGDMIAALPQGLEPDELIYRLVNWAVDKEREACAKLCEKMGTEGYGTIAIGIAIRARGIDAAKVGEVGVWGDKREWVGLTDEERRSLREWQEIQKELGPVWAPMMLYLYLAIEAKLKEKNS